MILTNILHVSPPVYFNLALNIWESGCFIDFLKRAFSMSVRPSVCMSVSLWTKKEKMLYSNYKELEIPKKKEFANRSILNFIILSLRCTNCADEMFSTQRRKLLQILWYNFAKKYCWCCCILEYSIFGSDAKIDIESDSHTDRRTKEYTVIYAEEWADRHIDRRTRLCARLTCESKHTL